MISALREQEGEGDAPPPGWGERFFDDAEALVGVEETVGSGEDPDMLGNGTAFHTEEDQRAGTGLCRFHLDHHGARALGQNLAWPGLGPIPTVGRHRERLGADDFPPDAACQPEAVAAGAAQARLVVIRRADPGPCDANDAGRIGSGSRASRCDALPPVVSTGNDVGHSTDPSCPPSLVA